MALQITWLGHASFKLQNDSGKTVYIDPWINGNPACSIEVKDIDKADIVCVTHGHFDHFGDSLEIVKNTGAKLVCSPDIGWYANSKGVEREKDSVTLDIGGSVLLDDIKISMVQAIHTCELYGEEWKSDKTILPGGGACGYVLTFFGGKDPDGTRVYYAGDTDVFADMKTIAELYSPQICILPIGDKYTMGIPGAVLASSWLQADVIIPMHFGTFPVLEQHPENFARRVSEKSPNTRVKILEPGDQYIWPEEE